MPDTDLCAASAAAYDPAAPGRRLTWRDMSALLTESPDGFTLAIEGTADIANMLRDADIAIHDDPDLGPLPTGAAAAADGFVGQLRDIIGQAPWIATGHSLGGWVAVILAGRMRVLGRPPVRVVGFDAPKPGTEKLAGVLGDVPGAAYRFESSVVSHWPFFFGQQFRVPVVIGDYTPDLLTAHSINRALGWMRAQKETQ
jgi:pimeloyl-ACP methyl ester carboxylesterase